MKDQNINPVKAALQAIGGTQSELARKLGVTPAVVTNWKVRGYITQKYLKKAVEVTGLPASVLNPYVPTQADFTNSEKGTV